MTDREMEAIEVWCDKNDIASVDEQELIDAINEAQSLDSLEN